MFGIEAFDENSVKVLGMEDFTLHKIFEAEIPAMFGQGAGSRSDYYELSVPGYVSSECYVLITPSVYYSDPQSTSTPYTPVYVELGGERIGVQRYINDVGSGQRSGWFANSAKSILEVYKVF